MATASLVLDIIANDKGSQAINNFASKVGGTFEKLGQKIGGEFGSLVSSIGQGLDEVGRSTPKLGQQLIAVGGAALAAGTALRALGSKDQAAQQQLQAAITATGNAWGDYQVQIEGAIKSSENFAHTADETQNALQTLTTATNDPAKALYNLQVVEDLAAARHIDLNSAAQLVAKTLEGSTRLLKQYGIATTGVATSTDKAQAAVNQLAVKLQGQAAASVNTFTGQLDVVKTKVTDFVSQLAGPVGAGLQGFGAGLALVGTVLESGFIAKLKTAASEAQGFAGKAKSIVSAIGPGAAGLGGVLAIAAIGLEVFSAAQVDGARRAQEYGDAIVKDTGALGQNTAAAIANELVVSGLAAKARAVGIGLGDYTQAILGNSNAQQLVNFQLDNYLTRIGTLPAVQGKAGSATTTYQQNVSDLRVGLGTNATALADQKQKYEDTQAATQAAAISLGDAAGATTAAGAAASAALTPLQLERKAYDALTQSLTTFNNLNISSQKADIATRDALAKVSAALKTSKGHFDLNTQAGRDARSAVLDFASAVDTQAQSLAAEGKPHSAIVALYGRERDALQQTLIKMGLTRSEAKRYADSLLKIPKSIQTQLTLEITAHVAQVTYARSVAKGQGAHVASVTANGPPKARGGPVLRGTAYLVGEHGSETFVPASNGTVLPHGAGGTVNNYITINTKADPHDVVRAIQTYDRANGGRR